MFRRERKTIAVAMLAVWLTAVSATGLAQQPSQDQQPTFDPDDVIKIESTLITVPVIISDRQGRYISGLRREDFIVTEDGSEQPIAQFSGEEEPVSVAILIDTSSSVAERLPQMKEAALNFVRQMRPQDRALVVSFNDQVYVDREFTSDQVALANAIQRLPGGDMTQLYEAIYLTALERLAPLKGRKAILLFSDGLDTASPGSRDQLVHYMEESGTFLYAVHFDPSRSYRLAYPSSGYLSCDIFGPQAVKVRNEAYQEPIVPAKQGEEFLSQAAQATGGRYYRSKQIDKERESTVVMAQIGDELRNQYALGYYAANNRHDGAFRHIRVNLRNRAEVAVRARRGYRAPLEREVAQNGEPKK